MDPRLQQAAESGSTDEFYALIVENPNICESFNDVPFINTPLHVAAASGNVQFAMEILNFYPSFSRKLNVSGKSPLHLAVEQNREDFVSTMLRLDPGLARVQGRNRITPFLSLVIRGKTDLVAECLLACPECIKDVNVDGYTALHQAVMSDQFEVLQVLTGWIQRNADLIEINFLNKVDFNLNTALHLAAYKNDHQAVRRLFKCWSVQRNKKNDDGLTYLDILRNQDQNASGELRTEGQGVEDGYLDLEQGVLKTGCKVAASVPITFWTYCSTVMRRLRSNNGT